MATAPTPEDFNKLKDRLIAATGSPGLTSFHDGKVHMTITEWERLIQIIEAEKQAANKIYKLQELGRDLRNTSNPTNWDAGKAIHNITG